MMEHMLAVQGIPARVVTQGVAPHFGCGTPVALQVRQQDQWTARLLLSPIDDSVD